MTHISNALALAVINDGDGSICGKNYAVRCATARDTSNTRAARNWTSMAGKCAEWHKREYGDDSVMKVSTADILLAAAEVAEYYHEHVKEINAVTA